MSARSVAARLPAPTVLERTSLAIAALDAVMSPDWDMRYYSFDPRWSPDERMASMRNGSGDSYNIVFGPAGWVVRGFDHESDLSPWGRPDGSVAPGILDEFPAALRSAIDEPAFRTEGGPVTDLTFCAWRLPGDEAWSAGPVDDVGGSAEWLLDVVLDGAPEGYQRFAAEYYEVDVPADVVAAFYALRPADGALVTSLGVEVDVTTVLTELREMSYPVQGMELTP
jgi:hypothetical protein